MTCWNCSPKVNYGFYFGYLDGAAERVIKASKKSSNLLNSKELRESLANLNYSVNHIKKMIKEDVEKGLVP